MRAHLSNATYGVLDYVAYPVGMLVAAPTLLHHLGAPQYGVWIVCTAVVSTGGIIASGFGDANIQYVATQRERGNLSAVARAVRSMLAINLLLGILMAAIGLATASVLARNVVPNGDVLYRACVSSLRIASAAMVARAIESVCISTQRAFERYGDAVRTSIFIRIFTIFIAIVVIWRGLGVVSIMFWTIVLMIIGTALQLLQLRRLLEGSSLMPMLDRETYEALFGFGIFSWLQAVSGVVFNQADRLILGASVGATAVTSYTLCVQMAQPIYGIAAAGLHFLFPYLARRKQAASAEHMRRTVAVATMANVSFVLCAAVGELLLGRFVLRAWVGEEIALSSEPLLAPVISGFALLGIGVTGYYAMLAFGRVRLVTILNLAGGAGMLLLMICLLPRMGVMGVAMARIAYGGLTLGLYLPLIRMVFFARHSLQHEPEPVMEASR